MYEGWGVELELLGRVEVLWVLDSSVAGGTGCPMLDFSVGESHSAEELVPDTVFLVAAHSAALPCTHPSQIGPTGWQSSSSHGTTWVEESFWRFRFKSIHQG